VSSMHIILFDIDGTLVVKRSTEADEKERFRRAVHDVVGRTPPIEPWRYDGMVDPEICRLLLIDTGLSQDAAEEYVQQVVAKVGEIYLTINKHPILNEGVDRLLRILRGSSNHRLGVLTGNLSAVGEEKLRLTSIREYFVETFYSNGYFDRGDLVRDAVHACVRKYHLRGNEAVTIVGDTPRDIEAARANNATAVGVATGFYPANELENAGASAVFQSLEPSNELLKALQDEGDPRLPC
jgi:phosphoglycolate phosphatase